MALPWEKRLLPRRCPAWIARIPFPRQLTEQQQMPSVKSASTVFFQIRFCLPYAHVFRSKRQEMRHWPESPATHNQVFKIGFWGEDCPSPTTGPVEQNKKRHSRFIQLLHSPSQPRKNLFPESMLHGSIGVLLLSLRHARLAEQVLKLFRAQSTLETGACDPREQGPSRSVEFARDFQFSLCQSALDRIEDGLGTGHFGTSPATGKPPRTRFPGGAPALSLALGSPPTGDAEQTLDAVSPVVKGICQGACQTATLVRVPAEEDPRGDT